MEVWRGQKPSNTCSIKSYFIILSVFLGFWPLKFSVHCGSGRTSARFLEFQEWDKTRNCIFVSKTSVCESMCVSCCLQTIFECACIISGLTMTGLVCCLVGLLLGGKSTDKVNLLLISMHFPGKSLTMLYSKIPIFTLNFGNCQNNFIFVNH